MVEVSRRGVVQLVVQAEANEKLNMYYKKKNFQKFENNSYGFIASAF